MRNLPKYLSLATLFLSASSCASSTDEMLQICGFSFRLEASAFRLLSQDDASCSAFLALGATKEIEETGSIIVFNHPPKEALRSIPSNFFVNSAGTISHRIPEPVSDDKNFYYVDDIEPLGNEKFSSQDRSNIEVFKYQRTVTKIDQNGEESSDTQICVDIMRYSNRITTLFAGCVDQSNGPSLHDRALSFMRTASTKS